MSRRRSGIDTETAIETLVTRDPGMRRLGRLMRTVGILGLIAGGAAISLGLIMLNDVEGLLTNSLELTAESLTTVDSSLQVATGTVDVVRDGLAEADRTSRGLQTSLTEGAALLEQTADLTRTEVAGSIESVAATLPTIVQVGGSIDSTLRTVDQLGGPQYEPEEPFDVTLQALQDNLAGLPGDLVTQADAIDAAGANLRTVGVQSVEVADAIGGIRTSLDEAGGVLDEYQTTASQAAQLLEETRADLGRRIRLLQVLVVVLGAIYCFGQLLPLYLGHRIVKLFDGQ